MKRLASVNVDSRFFKMVWSSSGSNDGLIVGACDNGQISVFNASKLLDGHPEPLVANQKKHSGYFLKLSEKIFRFLFSKKYLSE